MSNIRWVIVYCFSTAWLPSSAYHTFLPPSPTKADLWDSACLRSDSSTSPVSVFWYWNVNWRIRRGSFGKYWCSYDLSAVLSPSACVASVSFAFVPPSFQRPFSTNYSKKYLHHPQNVIYFFWGGGVAYAHARFAPPRFSNHNVLNIE